jgi:hypothetical protein
MTQLSPVLVQSLDAAERRQKHDHSDRDTLSADRLHWKAEAFRHLMHLLPGQSILVLGRGTGAFVRQLADVCHHKNPITVVTLAPNERLEHLPGGVEEISSSSFPNELASRQFDYVVGLDLLDGQNCAWLLQQTYELLRRGGRFLLFQQNGWSIAAKIRRRMSGLFRKARPSPLLQRAELAELISEIGFIRVSTQFQDFARGPLMRVAPWLLCNASTLLENMPLVRTQAGAVLIQAQKPPRTSHWPHVSLCRHHSLARAVSVVIPCYNEEMNIEPLVARLKSLFGDYLHEIVAVDDNSTDGTRAVIERLAANDPLIKPVIRTPPGGVGRALVDGYRAATGRWVLSMDCDFQHLLPEIADLFDSAAQGYDLVTGSRFSRHSMLVNYPFQKIVANRGFHALAQIVLLRRFRDLTNNLKLIRREVLQKLELREPGFAINAETGLQPLFMGYRVREVPISWINRTPDMGSSSFRLMRVGGGYVQVLWRLWLKAVFNSGPYKNLAQAGVHRKTWREFGSAPGRVEAV